MFLVYSSLLFVFTTQFLAQSLAKETIRDDQLKLREKRNAIQNPSRLWTSAVIPYELYPGFVDTQTNIDGKKAVLNAMKHIESKTCIRFKPRTDEVNFISIQNSVGCRSFMGRKGGNQTSNLRIPGCTPIYIAVHELMHTIGFAHAHSRHDRDEYIEIIWDNVDSTYNSSFRLLSKNDFAPLTEFDFDSIMLYGPTLYAKRNGLITMVSKVPGKKIKYEYEKSGLSNLDVVAINKLYKCNS